MNFYPRIALLIGFCMILLKGLAQDDRYMDSLRRVISTLKDDDTNKAFSLANWPLNTATSTSIAVCALLKRH